MLNITKNNLARIACISFARNFNSSSINLSKNLYEVLGVKSSATVADIKTAYYDLSKKLHPDKNKGCKESADKFREVTDAYEVLGNIKFRRLYDKGAFQQHSTVREEEPTHKVSNLRFYEAYSRTSRVADNTPTYMSSQSYNFDDWTKSHYSDTFSKERETLNIASTKRRIEEKSGLDSSAKVLFLVMAITILVSEYNGMENEEVKAVTYKTNDGKKK